MFRFLLSFVLLSSTVAEKCQGSACSVHVNSMLQYTQMAKPDVAATEARGQTCTDEQGHACTDTPTQWLLLNVEGCNASSCCSDGTINWHVQQCNRCANADANDGDPEWNTAKACQYSCCQAGCPYPGDVCSGPDVAATESSQQTWSFEFKGYGHCIPTKDGEYKSDRNYASKAVSMAGEGNDPLEACKAMCEEANRDGAQARERWNDLNLWSNFGDEVAGTAGTGCLAFTYKNAHEVQHCTFYDDDSGVYPTTFTYGWADQYTPGGGMPQDFGPTGCYAPASCERCPVGQCDPHSWGQFEQHISEPCIVYDGDGKYHCRLGVEDTCPSGYSCWEHDGNTFYSLESSAPCIPQ